MVQGDIRDQPGWALIESPYPADGPTGQVGTQTLNSGGSDSSQCDVRENELHGDSSAPNKLMQTLADIRKETKF